jgi:hypothetical protein
MNSGTARTQTNRLLTFSAAVECVTGVALMVAPSLVVRLLLGAELSNAAALALGRVAGFALLALGLAVWPGRNVDITPAALRAMLSYNSLTALYLLYLGLAGESFGPLLWPAVALHGIIALLLVFLWGRQNR